MQASVPARRRHPGRRAQLTFVGLGLTPVMVLLMLFSIVPIVGGLALSFFHYNGLDPQRPFVGLLNYQHLFRDDPLFYTALRNSILFVGLAVPLNILVTLPLAMALNKARRLRGILRTCFSCPSPRRRWQSRWCGCTSTIRTEDCSTDSCTPWACRRFSGWTIPAWPCRA